MTALYEREYNDIRSSANDVPLGSTITGRMSSGFDNDYFKTSVNSLGILRVAFTLPSNTSSTQYKLSLYDSSGNLHSYKWVSNSNSSYDFTGVQAGTTYLSVEAASGGYTLGDYSITPTFTSNSSSPALYEREYNDIRSSANDVPLGSTITGRMSSGFDNDYFKTSVNSLGILRVAFTLPSNTSSTQYKLSLYDSVIIPKNN